MKINSLFTILIFLFPLGIQAQNLVPNPSFENYTNCPTFFSEIFEAIGWNVPPNHDGTPDYFNACASVTSYVHVPNNAAGYEYAATGNGYAGLFLFDAKDSVSKTYDYREYIETELIQPLTAGVVYKVSLKYSLADSSFYTTNSFGVVLKSTSVNGQYDDLVINETPEWTATSNLDVTNGWTTLEFNYTAKGGERYIALGNFNSNANTPLSKNLNLKNDHHVTGVSSDYYCYIYLDDISVACTTAPLFSLGNDTLVCQGAAVSLQTSLINEQYQWPDSSINRIYTVTQPGIYWLKVTDPQTACFSIDTIQVKYKPLPVISLGYNLSLCTGQTIILDPMKHADSYLWQDGSTDSTYKVLRQGNYSVIMKINGCNTKAFTIVNYNPLPVINWGNDTTIYGAECTLNAGNPNSVYLWQDSSADQVYHVTQDGTYWVKVINNTGCTTSDTIRVKLGKIILDLPNVFTPNHDGINDYFIPAKMAGIQSLCIDVYDRWGERVYVSCDLNFSWSGDGFPEGLYYWNLHYTFDKNSENSKNGWIQLLR